MSRLLSKSIHALIQNGKLEKWISFKRRSIEYRFSSLIIIVWTETKTSYNLEVYIFVSVFEYKSNWYPTFGITIFQ